MVTWASWQVSNIPISSHLPLGHAAFFVVTSEAYGAGTTLAIFGHAGNSTEFHLPRTVPFRLLRKVGGDRWGDKLRFRELATFFSRWRQNNAAVEQWNVVIGMLCPTDQKTVCMIRKLNRFGGSNLELHTWMTWRLLCVIPEKWWKNCFLHWLLFFLIKCLLTNADVHFKVGRNLCGYDDASNFQKKSSKKVSDSLGEQSVWSDWQETKWSFQWRSSWTVGAIRSPKITDVKMVLFPKNQVTCYVWFIQNFPTISPSESFQFPRLRVETQRKLGDFTLEQLVLVAPLESSDFWESKLKKKNRNFLIKEDSKKRQISCCFKKDFIGKCQSKILLQDKRKSDF